MEISEIIDELTSERKAYAGIMSQSTFSNIVTRIKAGICKEKTKEEFLKKFGYVKVESVEKWAKK